MQTQRNNLGQFLGRENHPKWKGGRYLHKAGYWMIQKPDHPYCNKAGYMMEHRVIFEEYMTNKWGIKFIIHKSIKIHHIDENKANNDIMNLKLITHFDHMSLHKKGNKNNKKDLSNRICIECDTNISIDKNGNPKWNKYKNGYICSNCYARLKYRKKCNLTYLIKNCRYCNKVFYTFSRIKIYCNPKCTVLYRNLLQKTKDYK